MTAQKFVKQKYKKKEKKRHKTQFKKTRCDATQLQGQNISNWFSSDLHINTKKKMYVQTFVYLVGAHVLSTRAKPAAQTQTQTRTQFKPYTKLKRDSRQTGKQTKKK